MATSRPKKKRASLRATLASRAQDTFKQFDSDAAKRRASRMAVSVVEFQKSAMGNSISIIGKVQTQSSRIMKDLLKRASWIPTEGKEVVAEWDKMMNKGREDFKKTSDKSFDLVIKYLKRTEKQAAPKAKPATKKKAKTKAKPKKKAPAKKKSAKKKASKKK